MSDTAKRAKVLKKSTPDADQPWRQPYELAQVIERARKLAMDERATVMRQAQELARLRAILAALREPTEKVTRAAVRGYSGDMVDAIRGAVAAAEQEVDRE